MYDDRYSTSWDNLVKGTTTGVVALLVSLTVIFGLVSNSLLLKVALIILFGSILSVIFLWAPRGYTLIDNVVVIKRPIGDAKISIAQAASRWKWTWWGLRLFGSGGMYGYYGFFVFRGIGTVRMHATNRHKLVLVTDVNGTKYLLSPDEPERFIQQTKARFSAQTTTLS
jgi:hypothetical protein